MTKDSQQIEQAIEAVRRQPGSPAYAFLAEHYLEQENLDEAVRVCRAGFAANPGFERGAVAYLAVLRRLGEVDTASEVYGRAVAYLPRSARVRMGWALILADVGREREARNLAREALDLDPLSREARAFVATLGGTPAPTLAPGANPAANAAAHGQVSIVSEKSAQVRPWVRPIGQRTTPHSMFDLTPTPEILSEQVRKELSLFDLPAPDEEEPEERSVEVLVPVDLFEDTGAPAEPPPLHPAPTPTTLRAVPGAPLRPAPTPSPLRPTSTPPPPPIRAASTGPQPLRPTRTPPPPRPAIDEIEIEPDEMVPVGVPIEPSLSFEAEVQGEASGTRDPTSPELRFPPRRRRTRLVVLLASLVTLLVGGGVAGYLLYTRHQRAAAVARAVARMEPDLLESYLDARRELKTLVEAHPDHAAALGGLALADAHLVARFGAEPALEAEASRLAEQALQGGPSPSAHAAKALLAARAGDAKKVQLQIEAVPATERDWHHRLALVLAAIASGDAERAEATLAEESRRATPAPALLLEAAQLRLRRGEPGEVTKIVARGLTASPTHPGLRLLALLAAPELQPAALTALEAQARAVPRYRATLALARAIAAERRGATAEARQLVVASVQADPKDPLAAQHAARLLGGPGGDLSRALALLAPAASAYPPATRIQIAGLLLRHGRPHEARALLDALGTRLPPADHALAEALRIRAAALSEDRVAITTRCGRSAPGLQANEAALVFCAEALHALGLGNAIDPKRARPGATQRYLAGLRALSLGDSGAASTQLAKVERLELDPAAPLLALGRARAAGGDPAAAVAALRKALELDAGSARARVALASALCAAGGQAEAAPILDGVAAERPSQPSLVARAGEAYLTLGKPAKALALYEAARAQAGDAVSLRLLAGRVALAADRRDDARAHFRAVLERDPKNPEALSELGRLETAAGNDDAARKHLQAALRQRPKDSELLLAVARTHAQSGNYRKAFDSGMSSIRLLRRSRREGQAFEAMVDLARLLAQGDKWARARAEELLFEATRPKNAPATPFLELGRLYRQQNDVARTVWCFRQAVQRAPNLAEAHLELGLALRAKPQWRREAKIHLRQYLRLRPDGKEAEKIRSLVERMR